GRELGPPWRHPEETPSPRPPYHHSPSRGRHARRDGPAAAAHAAKLEPPRLQRRRSRRRRGGRRLTVAAAARSPIVHGRVDATASATLVLLCLCWGLNQVAIKVTNIGLQPVFQSGLRSFFGAILIWLWCRVRRVPLRLDDGTLAPGVIAGLLFGLEFGLMY